MWCCEINPHRDSLRAVFRTCAPSLQSCEIRMFGWPRTDSSMENWDEDVVTFPHLRNCGTVYTKYTRTNNTVTVAFLSFAQLWLWTTYSSRLFNLDETLLNVCADSLSDTSLISPRKKPAFPPTELPTGQRDCSRNCTSCQIPTLDVLDLPVHDWTDIVSSLNNLPPYRWLCSQLQQSTVCQSTWKSCQTNLEAGYWTLSISWKAVHLVRHPSSSIPAGRFKWVMSQTMKDEVRIYLRPFRWALGQICRDGMQFSKTTGTLRRRMMVSRTRTRGYELDDSDNLKENIDEDSGSNDDDSEDDDILAWMSETSKAKGRREGPKCWECIWCRLTQRLQVIL